jgi:catechol 2,3-dioxygenase-like lactoylglutathione lyase family enzyme/ketosteroid isomerase-like protein
LTVSVGEEAIMNTTQEQVLQLGQRWAEAEQRGDTATLDSLTTEDFTLVGPLGFVLRKPEWLERYRTGGLVTRSLVWDETTVRDYGETVVVVGRHTQRAEYRGAPADGTFRATHIVVRQGDEWRLAGLHLSPIAPPVPRTELNHTIVPSRDKAASADFLAGILGLPVGEPLGPFVPVQLSNGVTLDFMTVEDVPSQHYAFLVGEDEFDAAFARIRETGGEYWADPGHHQPHQINHLEGGRGVYFADPDGHNLELLTKA